MSSSQRQKISLPRLASLACASTLLQHEVNAIGVDELINSNIMAQVDADLADISQQDIIDGMLNNMAQDGVIRIPIKKQETGFLSQIYAESDSLKHRVPDGVGTQMAQTFDLNDPVQFAEAIQLGQLSNVQVKEPLTNS